MKQSVRPFAALMSHRLAQEKGPPFVWALRCNGFDAGAVKVLPRYDHKGRINEAVTGGFLMNERRTHACALLWPAP